MIINWPNKQNNHNPTNPRLFYTPALLFMVSANSCINIADFKLLDRFLHWLDHILFKHVPLVNRVMYYKNQKDL